MKSFFKELFEYNNHYNQKLCALFTEHDITERSVRWLNHILNAHHVWNNRIESKKPTFMPWDLHPAGHLKDMDNTNFEQSLQILDTFDLEEMIEYTNTKGETFENKVQDILFHIINHSTYHRAKLQHP